MSVGYEETVCLSLFLLAGSVGGLHHQGPVSSVYTTTPPLATGWERGLPGGSFPRHFNVLYRSCPKGWLQGVLGVSLNAESPLSAASIPL